MFTVTVTSSPAPPTFTQPEADWAGARGQSTETHTRSSLSTMPLGLLSTIHGALAATVNWNGVFPLLNTSMNRFGRLNGSNDGNVASPCAPGHADAEPSTATPIVATSRSDTSDRGGMVLRWGSCHIVYPMCVWSIMWFHFPPASSLL